MELPDDPASDGNASFGKLRSVENTPETRYLFSIDEESWMEARAIVQACDDLDLLERLYDTCGECEMQLAYLLHTIEERSKYLRG